MAFTVETVTGTTRTLTDSDDGKLLLFTNSAAITVTCPDTMTEGKELVCVQAGDGQITFVTSGAANFLNSATPVTRGKRSYVALTLESNANYAFNGAMGSDKVLVVSNYAATTAPTTSNDDSEGYSAGSIWINTSSDTSYICVDESTGAAVWVAIGNLFADGSVSLTGDLDAGGNTVSNLIDPTSNQDAATKNYVDTELSTKIDSDGTVAMAASLDMGTNQINNVVDPTSDQQAATKKYVDDNAATGAGDIKSDGTVPFAADQSMGGFKVTNLATPTASTDASTKQYVDDQISGGTSGFILADGSNPFASDQSMGSNKLTNVTDPTSAQDASTKNYVDTELSTKIDSDGTVAMSADLDMGTNQINNVVDPTLDQDAATKAYVDSNPNGAVLPDGSVDFTADQDMGTNKLTGLGSPTDGQDAANKTYVDNSISGAGHIKSDGTVAFSGDQSMGNNKITNLSAPTADNDASTKIYVDSAVSSAGNIKSDGSVTFVAAQSMGNNKITNLQDPTNAQDAATKAYVDSNGGGGSTRKPQEFFFKFQGEAAYGFTVSSVVKANHLFSFIDYDDGTRDHGYQSSTSLSTGMSSFKSNMNNQGQTRTRLEIKAHEVNGSNGTSTLIGEADYMFDWEHGAVSGEGTYRGSGNYNGQSCELFTYGQTWTTSSTVATTVPLWFYGYQQNIGTSSLGLYQGSVYLRPSDRTFLDNNGNDLGPWLLNFTEFNGSSTTTREMSYTYKFTNYFD